MLTSFPVLHLLAYLAGVRLGGLQDLCAILVFVCCAPLLMLMFLVMVMVEPLSEEEIRRWGWLNFHVVYTTLFFRWHPERVV